MDDDVVNQFDPLLQGRQSDGSDSSNSYNVEQADNNEQYLHKMQEIGDYIASFECDQSRRPRRGDVVSYYDDVYDDWLVVKVLGGCKALSKNNQYFNIRYLDIDREDDGLYLLEGEAWTFGRPVLKNQGEDANVSDSSDEDFGPDNQQLRVPEGGGVPSRQVSDVSSGGRLELSHVSGMTLPSHLGVDHSLKPPGLSVLNPVQQLQRGVVYAVPDVDVHSATVVDKNVLKRAERLHLPREQEHMRLAIAKSLVKPRSPRPRKSGLLNKILKRL